MTQKNLNSEQQTKIQVLENTINQLQQKLTNSEKEITDISKQLNDFFLFNGKIIANVVCDPIIKAEIKLIANSALDTTKSKVIISSSDAEFLGSEAYENREPITLLHMNT